MVFAKHLIELKFRAIYLFSSVCTAFSVAYFFSNEWIYLLTIPLLKRDALTDSLVTIERSLIFTDITEAFTTHLLLSFYVMLLFIIPLSLLQVWLFLAPGLYSGEKREMTFLFLASPFCFILGIFISYYAILPVAWDFFLSFEARNNMDLVPVHLEAKISEYLRISAHLFLVVGILFQYPIILLLFIRFRILKEEGMIAKRKFFIVASFILAAFFSPPDVMSQMLLAIPLLIFYEAALFLLILKGSYYILYRSKFKVLKTT